MEVNRSPHKHIEAMHIPQSLMIVRVEATRVDFIICEWKEIKIKMQTVQQVKT